MAVLLASHVNVCCAPGDTVAVSGSTVTLMALSFAGGGSFNVYTWWKGGGSQHIKCTHVLKIIIIVMQLMHENMCTQTRRNRVGYLRIALVYMYIDVCIYACWMYVVCMFVGCCLATKSLNLNNMKLIGWM